MQSLSLIVASNVALSALLALFAAAVTRVWRNPHLAHALWLLVLLKLITPPGLALALPEHWFAADPGAPHMPRVDEPSPRPAARAAPAPVSDASAAAVPAPELAESWSAARVDQPALLPDREPDSTGLIAAPDVARHSPGSPPCLGPLLPADPAIAGVDALSDGDAFEVPQPAGTGIVLSDAASGNDRAALPLPQPTADLSAWVPLLFVIWGAGLLVSAGLVVRGCLRFRGIVSRSLDADRNLSDEIARLAKTLGLRRLPPVRVVSARIPPLVWCCGFRPVVLLPRELLEALSLAQRRAVLAHELAHIRRRDHLLRWLEVLVLAAFWWNPVAWYARRRLRQAEEECCDAWVVWALPGERRSYGQALLHTIEFLTERRPLPSVSGSAFGGFPFKRRIEMILMRSTRPTMSRSAWTAMLLVTVLVLPVTAQVASPPAAAPAAEASPESPPAAAAPAAATSTPVPAAQPAATAPPAVQPASAAEPPAALPSPSAGPASAELPPVAPQLSRSSARSAQVAPLPSADPRPASDATAERADLEARLERLERLVETLIAERQTRSATTTPGARTYPDAAVPDSALRTAVGSRRVAVSRDGKLAAILSPGRPTSLTEIHSVERGEVLSVLTVAGRATEIRFSDDGRALAVKVGDEWKSYSVPDGWELPPVGDSSPTRAAPAAGVAIPPGSASSFLAQRGSTAAQAQVIARERKRLEAAVEEARAKLAAFLAEWEPEERLLRIDLQQAELKLEAAQTKLERLNTLKESAAVPADHLDEQKFAVRQAQLEVDRAATQLAIHRAKRKAAEDEARQAVDRASRELEELLKRHPADSETRKLLESLDTRPGN